MSYPNPRYGVDTVGGSGIDTGRTRSAVLWGHMQDRYAVDRALGTLYSEDFLEARLGVVNTSDKGWYLKEAGVALATSEGFTQATNSTIGQVDLTATTGTAHQAVEVIYGTNATPSATTALAENTTFGAGTVIHESRIDFVDSGVFFIGYSDPSGEFLTATTSLPSTTLDYIGFYRLGTDDLLFICSNGGTGGVFESVSVATTAQIESGYNKLGWAVDKDGAVIITRNGHYLETQSRAVRKAALPNSALSRRILVGRGAGSDATVTLRVDWFDEYIENALV